MLKSGGEPLPMEVAARWAPGRRLVNSYGPTEATVYAVRGDVTADDGKPMIGRPATNTKIYILDPQGRPVPVGVPGELHIGGINVARGYVNRPDLTARQFVTDPFDPDPKARLYKTGDRARYRADGTIDYLGRDDDQVKIRGMRVELAEVEAALSRHPEVSACCAVLREDRPGDKRLVGYVVHGPNRSVGSEEFRRFLRQYLPDHMVPVLFETLDALPLTPNGKVDRRALPVPKPKKASQTAEPVANKLQHDIAAIWKDVLDLQSVGLDDNFFDAGGHSLAIIQVQARLESDLGVRCEVVDLFQNPTVRSISRHLEGLMAPDDDPSPIGDALRPLPASAKTAVAPDAIAIIGMAGRFPGAADIGQFWTNLRDGVESIADLDDGTLDRAGIDPQLYKDPRYVKREGVLDGVDLFEPEFFGYTPKDAAWMDPQQRILLETAWHALEHAGYGAAHGRPTLTGVFAGVGASTYLSTRRADDQALTSERLQLRLLNAPEFTATRIGYKLNLQGPCVSVQTACSTSLVAAHLACQSLRTGDADMALAGGVSIAIPHGRGYLYQAGHIYSPDGRCRAFDVDAQGIVRGSGAAVVVLKRLGDAVRDGDCIWAVIKGSAVNNDGAAKVGFTAPSVDGQAAVIDAALRDAGIHPDTIGYVEAHGTGTFLGDPIEVAGLSKAFGAYTTNRAYCAIGSLKTNVGHLDTAAGAAGLIKAALALHHRSIPVSLHFRTANPNLNLEETPFHVSARTADWTNSSGPRRAGISSFGIGGTNAHVILEEAPEADTVEADGSPAVLALSAASQRSLAAMCRNLADHLRRRGDRNLQDVAFSLQVGREPLHHRLALVCNDQANATTALEAAAADTDSLARAAAANRDVVFMFPGQGSQHVGMGQELYRHQPVYRESIDGCAERLIDVAGVDFRPLLYADSGAAEAIPEPLSAVMQPVLFAVEYALAQLLLSWGIRPASVIGHSIGEYAAAAAAGVMTSDDAVRLTFARGDLVRHLPAGAVLAVSASHDTLNPYMTSDVSLAAINGPRQCVVSGKKDAVSALFARLQSVSIPCQLINATHAVHSGMVDPILSEFEQHVRRVELRAPRIPFMSTVTGSWASGEQLTDPKYWVQNLRNTVNFASGIVNLLSRGDPAFVEVGPGITLARLVEPNRSGVVGRIAAVATMPPASRPTEGHAAVLGAVGELWSAGVAVDWRRLHAGEARRRVPLPGYHFDRKRYWVELKEKVTQGENVAPTPQVYDGGPINTQASAHEVVTDPASDLAADDIEALIRQIFQDVLGRDKVGPKDRFFDLGGDSLMALSVLNRIERTTGQTLAPATLLENQTPRKLAQVLRREVTAEPKDLLVPIQVEGSKPPLFCPHPFGGHVMFYVPLAKAMGTDQPLFGIEARGLSGEAAPHTSITAMAADYIKAVRHVQPTGPFHFVGLSMGGSIAWEMACQLQEQGEDTVFLGLLDARADHGANSSARSDHTRLLGHCRVPSWLSEEAIRLSVLFPDLRACWDELSPIGSNSHAVDLFAMGRERGLVPDIGDEQLAHITRVAEANRTALHAYVPRRRIGGAVLFAAEDGLKVTDANSRGDLGWCRYAAGPLEVVDVPGDHYSMVKPPHVNVLAQKLSARLSGREAA